MINYLNRFNYDRIFPRPLPDGIIPPVINPLHSIGALTRVGAGGRTIAASNGTYGPYTVAGGVMTPNTTPVTPGTYDVGGITITAEPDVYDCGTGELGAIVALGAASLNGKTIKVLPGADACGSVPRSTVAFGTMSVPLGIKITSRDISNRGFLRRLTFGFSSGVLWLDAITCRDYYVGGASRDQSFTGFIVPLENTSGSANSLGLKMTRCEVFSDRVADQPQALADGTEVNHGYIYYVRSVASANWSSIGGPVSAVIGDQFVASVSNPNIAALGTVRARPVSLRAIQPDTRGANQTRSIEVTDCYFHDIAYAMSGKFNDYQVKRNLFENSIEDQVQFAPTGNETRLEIDDNVYRGSALPSANPLALEAHTDFCQLNMSDMTIANTVPFRFRRNYMYHFAGQGGAQNIFIADPNASTPQPVLVEVTDNVISGSLSQGIIVERAAVGSVIARNTLIRDQSPNGSGINPALQLSAPQGVVDIRDNLYTSLTASLAFSRQANNTLVANTNGAIAAVLAGTTFDSTGMTVDQFKAATAPRIGGPLDVSYGRKVGAGWYTSYGAVPVGSVSGLAPGSVSLPAAVVPAQITTFNVLDAGNSLGLDVSITDPSDGGDFITSYDYQIDGGSWVSGGASREFRISSGMTIGTPASIRVRAVNSIGPGATSDPLVRTPTNSYTINGVVFDAATINLTTGFSATGSTSAFMSFNFYVDDVTWPSSGSIVSFLTSVGNLRHRATFASSGRLNIQIADSAGVSVGGLTTNTGSFAVRTWYTVIAMMDTTKATTGERFQVFMRPSGGSWTSLSGTRVGVLNGVADSVARYQIAEGLTPPVWLADLYATFTQTLDILNVPAERDKFLPTVSKGANGSIPTGTSPAAFFSGPTSTWHENKGTGGGNQLSGTPTTAPSVPA